MRKALFHAIAISALGASALAGLAFWPDASVSAKEVESSPRAEAQPSRHWGYEGAEGPEFWGELASEFSQCSIGTQQSPIDLKRAGAIDANLDELAFNYQPTPLDIVNNGHTIQVNYAPGSTLTLDGQTYDLLQFHFHDPSEHTVDGEPHPMEAHLVHKNSTTGDLTVVGIFLDIGAENEALQTVWEAMPREAGPAFAVADVKLNAMDLLPANTQDFYRYSGSLTTPPCSEIVNWIVMKEPVEVSFQQVERFAATVGENARPTQASNRRFVLD
ncbi:MAG: carbonic anhydrase family protein [Cyanobacteria bacterium J06639_1]